MTCNCLFMAVLVILVIFVLVLVALRNYKEIQIMKTLYLSRDYYDTLLMKYIRESYEAIYSKHVLPFIANNTTISLDSNDKYFLSLSKTFLDVLKIKLGNMLNDIYLRLYTYEQFRDLVLLKLTLLIQDDMMNTVISKNMESGSVLMAEQKEEEEE